MANPAISEPVPSDDKALDYDEAIATPLPSVPLDDIEVKSRGRAAQLLSVLVSGVALFSDGYNIQVTGMFRSFIPAPEADILKPTQIRCLQNFTLFR